MAPYSSLRNRSTRGRSCVTACMDAAHIIDVRGGEYEGLGREKVLWGGMMVRRVGRMVAGSLNAFDLYSDPTHPHPPPLKCSPRY